MGSLLAVPGPFSAQQDGLKLQYLLAAAEKSAHTQTWQSLPGRTAHT